MVDHIQILKKQSLSNKKVKPNLMIIESNQPNTQENTQILLTMKDLVLGERIKKVTTHDLFELVSNDNKYVAKIFKPEFHHNFVHEVNTLRQLNHPNILQVVYSQSANSQSIRMLNCDMILFNYADHGSLNEYIPLNGKLSEDVSRVIFMQLVSALKYAANKQPKGFIHPNLLPSNILLDSEHQVKICGWSQECEKKQKKDLIKDLLFNCCEILILMLTGYMPFFKKDQKFDPLYRYVNKEHIVKFWQLFQKRISSKHKQFKFTTNLKQMIQKVFLQQWTTFEQIQNCVWIKQNVLPQNQYKKQLESLQLQSKQRRQQLTKKHSERFEEKKRILSKYEQETIHGGSNRSSGEYDAFIQDYYENSFNKHDVPASQCSELIQMFDDRPNFIIATLKQHLKKLEQEDTDWIFCGQFALQTYNFYREGNRIYLRLIFKETDQDIVEKDEDLQVNVMVLIKFFHNPMSHLCASVELLQSSLNEFYASQVMRFIWNSIKLYAQ